MRSERSRRARWGQHTWARSPPRRRQYASGPEERAMGNPFVHVELNTTDLAKAKAFYGKLFDWKLEDAPMADGSSYTVIDVSGGTGGGMMKQPMPGAPSMWL